MGGTGADENSSAHADLDATFDLERNKCLAHGRTRHFQPLGQFTLRGQACTVGVIALLDQRANLVSDLFLHETDAIRLVKYKEIYETLENATDRCEDVADILQTIVVKNS